MRIMQNNYGFVRLCYGVVGSYKDTSNMTTDEVIEEFLRHEGVRSVEEYYDKAQNNTYGNKKQMVLTKQAKRDKINRKSSGNERKQVILPPKEYGMVMHEFATNVTEKQKRQKRFKKHIGDYIYDVEYVEHFHFIITGKTLITGGQNDE